MELVSLVRKDTHKSSSLCVSPDGFWYSRNWCEHHATRDHSNFV